MLCFVDYRITMEEELNLLKQGLKIIKIPKCNKVYNAINGHVDIQLCIVDKAKRQVVINKEAPSEFKKLLTENDINFLNSHDIISSPYPNNVSLNALVTEKYFIHNLKCTDKSLLNCIKDSKHLINVKQGYTKCSCLYLKDNVVITNDFKISKTLLNLDFDVLYLPYGDIVLEDFEYGFIGGVGGMITPNKLALYGNLKYYKYGDIVLDFLNKHNITPIYLSNSKLTDRGSIFVI